MNKIEIFKQHLIEKRAVKVCTGINNFDIENIKNSIDSTLELIKNKNLFPLTGNNQIEIMLAIEPYSKKLSISVDIAKLSIGSS